MNRDDFFFDELTWNQYVSIKNEYGFCSSWALWDEEILNNTGLFVADSYSKLHREKLLIAKDEEDFKKKKLNKKLNKNIVFLAYNSSFDPKKVKDSIKQQDKNKKNLILEVYKDFNKEELAEEDCKKFNAALKKVAEENEEYVFNNTWADAGYNHKGAGYYLPIFSNYEDKPGETESLLSGAYITDFIKVEKGYCCAVPISDSKDEKLKSYLKGDKLNEQIKILSDEVKVKLGVKKPCFVLLHKELNTKEVKDKLKEEFGKNIFIGYSPHYTQSWIKDKEEYFKDNVVALVNDMKEYKNSQLTTDKN